MSGMTQTPTAKPRGTVRIVLGVVLAAIGLVALFSAFAELRVDAATGAGQMTMSILFLGAGTVLVTTGIASRRSAS